MENFPNMVVTMVHFFLQQLETFSTLGIKFNFRYIGVLHPWLQHSRLNNIVGEKAFLHSHSGVQLNTVATQKVDILKPVLFCLHFIQLLLIKGSGWTLYCPLVTITYYSIVRRPTEPEPELGGSHEQTGAGHSEDSRRIRRREKITIAQNWSLG